MSILEEMRDIDLAVYGGDDVARFCPPPKIPSRLLPEVEAIWEEHSRNHRLAIEKIANILGQAPRKTARGRSPWTLDRILQHFRQWDDRNTFAAIAAKTRYGVYGILGNDCYPEERYAFDVPGVREIHHHPQALGGWGFVGIEGSITTPAKGRLINSAGILQCRDEDVSSHLEKAISSLKVFRAGS